MANGPITVSVLLLAYNQIHTIAAAARSILEQDNEAPIEILLSDDASQDGTFAELEAIARPYRGRHVVRLFQNSKNLGIGAHYNKLVELASGRLLVTAAGDDVSHPSRVRKILQAWSAHCEGPDLIASHLYRVDTVGREGPPICVDALEEWCGVQSWCKRRPYVVGAGHAFTRRLFDQFGPLDSGLVNEDQVLVLRALMSGGALTVREPLVGYRAGGVSAPRMTTTSASFIDQQRRLYLSRRSEMEQMVEDARLYSHHHSVEAAVQYHRQRNEFIGSMLAASGCPLRVFRKVFESPNDLLWRLRKGVYFSWPFVPAAAGRARCRLQRSS